MNSSRSLLPWFAATLAVLFLVASARSAGVPGGGAAPTVGPACGAAEDFFLDEVWTKVGALSCLKCHKAGGDADDSKLVLRDPATDRGTEGGGWQQHNREAFMRMAVKQNRGESRLLLKARGELEHGGEAVLKPDSTDYRILAEYVRRLAAMEGRPAPEALAATERNAPSFFAGVAMMEDGRLLRRLTLSLAGRLPKPEEVAAVRKGGLDAIGPVLDGVMKEEAFYERLAEAFNDIFLTRGYDDGAESALSYDNFSETRHWTQKFDLTSAGDEKAQQKARYKLDDNYREALLREPMELVKYIVRNDHPFTEIVTADYIMVSPYTARGYGIYDQLREQFKDPQDPFEYVPTRLPSLKSREGPSRHQESPTGFYPHAGILSTFQYLRRYPTTETNRNRLRARMYYAHFLGIDVLELAARVTDAAAVSSRFSVPTMQAAECVVCHRTVDPVAGIFQDYYSLDGVYGPRKDGWFTDIFDAGLEGEDLPPGERWRALPWLGERTAKDPRFATTMVEHVYYVMTGRKALLPPKAIDDPLFRARQRAYLAQQQEIQLIAARLASAGFNLKEAFRAWAVSPFYRADSLATAAGNPERAAELADLGVARMLGPEQLERKIAAIFGAPWGRLKETELAILYGGIDTKEVTERAADPSGAMGALQRTMANEVACKNVGHDFSLPAEARRLFPKVEPDLVPDGSPATETRIREQLVYLHRLILGREVALDDPELNRSFELFQEILNDAGSVKGLEPLENYSCRAKGEERVHDSLYTIRAWRGVLTYLLRQPDFLYE